MFWRCRLKNKTTILILCTKTGTKNLNSIHKETYVNVCVILIFQRFCFNFLHFVEIPCNLNLSIVHMTASYNGYFRNL